MLLEYDLDRYSMGNFMECWWKPSGHQTISNKACWKTHHFNIYFNGVCILRNCTHHSHAKHEGVSPSNTGAHDGLFLLEWCIYSRFDSKCPPMFGTQTWIFLYICICSIDPIFSQGFVSGGIRFNTRGKRLGNVVNPLRTHFLGTAFHTLELVKPGKTCKWDMW